MPKSDDSAAMYDLVRAAMLACPRETILLLKPLGSLEAMAEALGPLGKISDVLEETGESRRNAIRELVSANEGPLKKYLATLHALCQLADGVSSPETLNPMSKNLGEMLKPLLAHPRFKPFEKIAHAEIRPYRNAFCHGNDTYDFETDTFYLNTKTAPEEISAEALADFVACVFLSTNSMSLYFAYGRVLAGEDNPLSRLQLPETTLRFIDILILQLDDDDHQRAEGKRQAETLEEEIRQKCLEIFKHRSTPTQPACA